MKKLLFAFTVVMTALVFQSCDKDDVLQPPAHLKAPAIPPAVLYTIPTSEVSADSVGTDGEEVLVRSPRTNWIHAGTTVAVWNAIVVLNLALPVNAIGHAFNQNAEYIGNDTYAWTYQYVPGAGLGGGTYNVVLTGQYISSDEVAWTLTASQAGGFQNFAWVTAVIKTDFSAAEFVVNRYPMNPQSYLQINSSYDPFTQQASVKLTNIIPGDLHNGHYIAYGADNANDLNRSFSIFAGANDMMDIEWNAVQYYGRVRHGAFYGDNDWHCWDTQLFDTDCN
jgi:hypothetical protein